MAKERPVREWETLDETDALVGRSWIIESEHHGHTMLVLGRIDDSSMILVSCSCGEEFRMADATVDKHV